jgi:hypothetical protein
LLSRTMISGCWPERRLDPLEKDDDPVEDETKELCSGVHPLPLRRKTSKIEETRCAAIFADEPRQRSAFVADAVASLPTGATLLRRCGGSRTHRHRTLE